MCVCACKKARKKSGSESDSRCHSCSTPRVLMRTRNPAHTQSTHGNNNNNNNNSRDPRPTSATYALQNIASSMLNQYVKSRQGREGIKKIRLRNAAERKMRARRLAIRQNHAKRHFSSLSRAQNLNSFNEDVPVAILNALCLPLTNQIFNAFRLRSRTKSFRCQKIFLDHTFESHIIFKKTVKKDTKIVFYRRRTFVYAATAEISWGKYKNFQEFNKARKRKIPTEALHIIKLDTKKNSPQQQQVYSHELSPHHGHVLLVGCYSSWKNHFLPSSASQRIKTLGLL